MVFPLNHHFPMGFPMVFLWNHWVFPWIFPWFSYVLTHRSLAIPHFPSATPRDPSARQCRPPWDRPTRPRRASSLGKGTGKCHANWGKTHGKMEISWENPWENHGNIYGLWDDSTNIWVEISTAFLKSRIDRGTANELEENDAQRPQVYLPRTWVMLMVGDYNYFREHVYFIWCNHVILEKHTVTIL